LQVWFIRSNGKTLHNDPASRVSFRTANASGAFGIHEVSAIGGLWRRGFGCVSDGSQDAFAGRPSGATVKPVLQLVHRATLRWHPGILHRVGYVEERAPMPQQADEG